MAIERAAKPHNISNGWLNNCISSAPFVTRNNTIPTISRVIGINAATSGMSICFLLFNLQSISVNYLR
jgi:hypothetical protein